MKQETVQIPVWEVEEGFFVVINGLPVEVVEVLGEPSDPMIGLRVSYKDNDHTYWFAFDHAQLVTVLDNDAFREEWYTVRHQRERRTLGSVTVCATTMQDAAIQAAKLHRQQRHVLSGDELVIPERDHPLKYHPEARFRVNGLHVERVKPARQPVMEA